MRQPPLIIALAAFAASTSSVFAEATPEGAKAMESGYAAFLSRDVIDKGLLSVAPDGEDYVVTWDFQKAIDESKPKGEVTVEPFSYRLTPGPGGSWIFKSAKLPKIVFDTQTDKGHSSGVIDFQEFTLDGLFDPAATPFLRANSGIGAASADVNMEGADQPGGVKLVENDIKTTLSAKPSSDGAGIDVALAQAAAGLTETIAPRASDEAGGKDDEDGKKKDDEAVAPAMTFTTGRLTGESSLIGLRGREIGDLWQFVVTHAKDQGVPAELKAKLQAALPVWKELSGSAEFGDVKFEMPQAKASLKSFGESIRLSGFTEKGVAEFGLTLRDLAVDTALAPEWAKDFWPASLDFKVTATSDGWDKIANLALADPNFGGKDMAAETQQQMLATLMSGHPKVLLAPGSLSSPTLNLTFEGAAAYEDTGPSGHAKITADSLDKTMAILAKLGESDPQAKQMMLGLTFVKGLAKDESGRLAWNVDVDAKGAVTVNGQLMPTK